MTVAGFEQLLVNGLILGCIYALIALGYTLIFGIIKVIFFAQGDISMVGAFAAFGAYDLLSTKSLFRANVIVCVLLSLTFSILVAALIGYLSERIALRPLRHAHRTKQLIASLGVSLVLQNIVFLFISSESRPFPTLFHLKEFPIGSVTVTNLQILIVTLVVPLMVGLELFVNRSRLGLAMRAVAENRGYAELTGINVNRTVAWTFALGGALAATAGLMMGLYDGVIKYDMGFLPGIKGFTAAILGGIGNVRGGVVGGMVLGLVETIGSGLISSTYRHLFAFAALIAILTFRPSGILRSQKS